MLEDFIVLFRAFRSSMCSFAVYPLSVSHADSSLRLYSFKDGYNTAIGVTSQSGYCLIMACFFEASVSSEGS